MPLPGNNTYIAGVKGRLKQVLLMSVVVNVALEKLQEKIYIASVINRKTGRIDTVDIGVEYSGV